MAPIEQAPTWNREDLERKARKLTSTTLEDFATIMNGGGSKDLQETLLQALTGLAEQGMVAPLYELWCKTREPRLTAALTEGGYVTGFASHLKVFRCLESGDLIEVIHGGPGVVEPLVKATEDSDRTIRNSAMECLENLDDPDALDALCTLWAEQRPTVLRSLIERRTIVARKPPSARVLSALASNATDVVAVAGEEAVVPLVQACSDADADIAERAKKCLTLLSNEDAIDAFADIWAHNRPPELDRAMVTAGYVARKPASLRVLTALKTGRADLLTADSAEVAYPLVLALDDPDNTIVERAIALLDSMLDDAAFQDALCQVVIEHGLDRAADIAVQQGCKPVDSRNRALYYFLTEQWEEYESLDFDMSILTELFEHGGKDLRSRISAKARQAGRLELVELVAGVRHRRRMGEMTEREWGMTLGILTDRSDWETTWRLAQSAPSVWSVRALEKLDEVGWRPERREDVQGFERLLKLAYRCESEAPILGVVDEPFARFTAHGRRVSRLIVSSYFENTLASASWDGTVRLWAMADGRALKKWAAHRHPITAIAANPDGSVMASGCGAEDWVVLWTTQEGAPFKVLRGHVKGVACLAMSPDGRLLAAGCYDGKCRLWRVRDGALLKTLAVDKDSVRSVVFSPEGKIIATGGEDAQVRLWSVPEGEPLATLTGHSMTVRSLVFTPDGKYLASGSSDNTIILWSMPEMTLNRRLLGHTNVVTALAVSNDGRVLASAGWDRAVRLWVMPEGRAWGALEEHSGPVTCLTTDPESRVLVSGGHDCTVMMWNFQSGIFRRPTTRKDMDRIESLSEKPADADEAQWLDFLHAQMKWRWRFDIEIDGAPSKIEVGEFDIEVEG